MTCFGQGSRTGRGRLIFKNQGAIHQAFLPSATGTSNDPDGGCALSAWVPE